jgi:sugar O-acyltransferase (sialic acid O-acetyltransferase NeuD family)
MELYGIFGIGGFGREVISLVKESLVDKVGAYELVFIDESISDGEEKEVNGYRALSLNDFIAYRTEVKKFNVAVANYLPRKKIADRLIESGAMPFSIRAANSVNLESNDIAEGSIICSYVTISPNTKIGKFFHANFYSYVAHDCIVGDYVTFAPNVICCGNVVVENFAYIGASAVIKQSLEKNPISIGEGAIVGMGAVVTKSVEPYTVVVGNPAKKIRAIKNPLN